MGKSRGQGSSPELNLSSYKKKNDQQYELLDADGKYVQMLEVIDERNMVLRGKSPEGDLKARRAFVAPKRVVLSNKQRNPIPPCSPEDAASLLDAASQSNMRRLKEMLEKGVHPDVEVEGRAGALNTAALRGKKEMIQLMLDKGADINNTTFS